MINTKKSPIALAEVYDIIEHSNEAIKEKIPDNFIKLLKDNMDEEYVTNIDYNKNVVEQNIQQETKIILGIIYRDFLCDNATKKLLISKEKKELAELELRKKEKYNIDNIFKPKENVNDVQNVIHENTAMVEYKPEKWYKKMWNKIKSIFK